MTNHWVDIKNADVILIMGGNAAEAHPCGFKWVTEAKANRKAKLVVVDPRFTRSAAMADQYAPLRVGTDIAFLNGVINYLITNNKIQEQYVKNYTNAPFLINADFKFNEDGTFSGYNAEKRTYDRTTWSYQRDEKGFAKVDESMQDPACVWQLMKTHFSRYTPEVVERICGTPKDRFLQICETIATTAAPDRAMTIMYALGWTQHTVGSQMIRSAAILQLLLGNVGVPGGGVNALRGHANVQGITDMNLVAGVLPGYLRMAGDGEQSFKEFIDARALKPLRPGQMSFPQNFGKWYVSLHKAWWGDAATPENDFAYHYMPKNDRAYDILAGFELMHQGRMQGFLCQGFNPLASLPNKKKLTAALSKLKYLVVIDPMQTETDSFWENIPTYNEVDTKSIQTEVFRLPTTCFAEDVGSFTNSGRTIQWHWKGADPPGEARSDLEVTASLFLALRDLYAKEGGKGLDPLMKLTWPYSNARNPNPEEVAREINGRVVSDVVDPKDPTKVLLRAGEQLPNFAVLRDDGSTACGNWIYAGIWTQAGNMTARRDTSDPSGLGSYLNWGFTWPANRHVLYNRAAADANGKPWDPKRPLLRWTGTAWGGADVPDMRPNAAPDEKVGPFIMNPEGVARLFALGGMNEGPFPEHYEPFETPIGTNPLHAKTVSNPAARVYKGDMEQFGKPEQFPYAATSYRLTEHMHFWTKGVIGNAIVQPEQFVEIGEELAREKGLKSGDTVEVRSARGVIKTKVAVTKRIKQLTCDGKKIHTVGLPIHWGFKGVTKPGHLTNTLTPYVGDANSQTPDYKSFLVDIKKA
jgi:formate dehydrogenase major subunit